MHNLWQSREDYTVVQSLHLCLVNTSCSYCYLQRDLKMWLNLTNMGVQKYEWKKNEVYTIHLSNLVGVEFAICLLLVLVLYWDIPSVTRVIHLLIASFSSGCFLLLFSSYYFAARMLPGVKLPEHVFLVQP